MYKSRLLQILIFVFVSVALSSCFATWIDNESKAFYAKSVKEAPVDVVIVPGYPFDGEKWDKIVKLRVVWATYLFNQGITKNIIFSGSAVYTPYVESQIMKYYAMALGVPEEHIFTEERAEHSTENVFLSYQLAQSKGFEKIALATDPFQSKWMLKFYEAHDCKLDYFPCIMEIVDSLGVGDPTIPYDSAFVENFVSIKKRESFKERWRGTKGKNIDFEKGVIRKN